jgi:HSP20 family protein
MTLSRIHVWDPVRETLSLRDAMSRLFEDSFVRMPQGTAQAAGGFAPVADAWEDGDAVTIEMILPGMNPDQVEVTFEQDSLVVSGELPEREDDRTWILRERARGRFTRRFTLGVPIDPDRVEASFTNGVLSLRLAKREEIKPRKIAVNVQN